MITNFKLFEDLEEEIGKERRAAEFKVGDQIVFTYLDDDDTSFKYNTVYTIHRDARHVCYIINEKGVGDYFQKTDIRKATPLEIQTNKYNL